jgi:hypothetical protein
MQLYRRPTPPDGFPNERWESVRQAAEEIIEAELKKLKKKKPVTAQKGRKSFTETGKKKDVFPGIWKDFKAYFSYAQFGKCGFCESPIVNTYPGDVEHYRPKSAISALRGDVDALGQQQEALGGITGRLTHPVSAIGYYWLAYEWSNYLLACSICNGLKGTIFPVKNDPRIVPPLKNNFSEEPLLLNPFEKKLPASHLKFQPNGFVQSKTLCGRATIETCGLYREELRKARVDIALRVYDLARDLRRPANKRDSQTLRDCYDFGADDARHCGMVRSILEGVAETSWKTLVMQYAKELALELKRTRNAERKKEADRRLEKSGRERFEHSSDVRAVFERVCGIPWAKLVERHAQQFASDFMACKKDWQKDAGYELSWKFDFYMLARDNLSHVVVVKEAYEKKSRMSWAELKAEVEAKHKFLWKLP